jgi:hypothetical protein
LFDDEDVFYGSNNLLAWLIAVRSGTLTPASVHGLFAFWIRLNCKFEGIFVYCREEVVGNIFRNYDENILTISP